MENSQKAVMLVEFSHDQRNLQRERLDEELSELHIPFTYLDELKSILGYDPNDIKCIVFGYCHDNVDPRKHLFNNSKNYEEYKRLQQFCYSSHLDENREKGLYKEKQGLVEAIKNLE